MVLVGTLIAFVSVGRTPGRNREEDKSPPVQGQAPSIETLAREVRDLKQEVETESVAEEVVENLWFEWLGIVGAAVISSSFYFEAIVRRRGG